MGILYLVLQIVSNGLDLAIGEVRSPKSFAKPRVLGLAKILEETNLFFDKTNATKKPLRLNPLVGDSCCIPNNPRYKHLITLVSELRTPNS